MNPYAYPQAQLQQQQPQQYQYQAQYTQQQPYYYVQPSQAQLFQTPQQYPQYGAVAYQTPQTAASAGQYSVQGYAQVAGAQQYVAASAPGQNFYPAAVQVNQRHDQATAQKDAPIASEERPPPLPPEQVDSSTPAPPPLPPEPAPNSLSVEQKISEAQKQYQEKYAEWQRQYAQWQAQHQNHPDQRQYQEWQQQMKHWTQHNQTLMQIKGGDEQQQPVQQQPIQQQPIQQQPIQQQPIQQQPIQQQPIQQQPIQQQPIQQQQIQQQPIQQQPIQQQAAVGSVSAPAQGHTVVKQQQQQQYQQYQQQSQHQQQAPQHQQQQPQHQQQSQHQQQQQPQQQQLYSQQTPFNQHQSFVHNQRQPVQAQWSQGNSSQNTPGHYNQQQNPNHFNQRQSQQQQWQSQYYDKNKTSNWTQNQNNRNRQSSQNYNQGPLPQKIPGLMDVQPVRPQNDSKIQHKNEFTSEESHLPKWMQSSKATARPSELEQSSSWTHKSAAAENKHVPKWLQSQNSSSNQQQHQDDNGMPRWLKEKLEKTEWDVKQEAAKKALQATEVQKKHIPKWLQEGSSKSDQAKTVTPGKQMPNWLSNNKPFPVGNQGEDHQTKVQIPKWLQAKMPATGRNTTGQINSGETSTKTGSKWDKVERNTSSTMIGVSADNLDPIKELEFLRKQQEQLQQLEKLEKQLKQTSPALSTMGKSESTTTTSSSSVVTSNQVEKAANNPWLQYSLSGQANDKSSAADHNKGTTVRNSKAKGKKQACKFFPNCRFGIGCKFQHPPCKNGLRCENDGCIFDHSEDSSNEQNAEESQYSGDFPDESEMQSQGIVSLTSKRDQIPGIGDGEYPIKPAQTLDKTKTDGDSNDKDNYQGSKYPQSQGDYMDVESDQYQGEEQPQVSAEGEQSVPTASRQNETEHFQQSEHPEHVWGPRGDPERPPYFGERHPKDALPWDKEKPHQDLDRPPPPSGDRFLGWDREHPPTNRDRRPPPPREGQYGDEDLHRRDWRPPFDRHNSGPRPPSPRGERDFDPFRHDRDRPPPFPPGDRDKGPWLDQPGGRPPFPREEWDRKPPFPRDRPPFPVDERHPQEQYGRRSPLLGRHTWEERPPLLRDEKDQRPPFRDVKEGGPPVPGTEADHRPHNIGAIDTYSKQDEQGKEGHQIPREPTDKEPPEMEGGERPPYPRDEQPRPPSPRQDWDRPPFPQDHWDRPPFPRDEWDRSPFPRDDRDLPPFPRDEWDRPPFPRDEREWPPHAREERDRRPFPRDERDFPFPPRGGRDHWPPPVRDERERWPPPLPPGERDEFRWFSREHGPPGRSMSPRGRDGHRGRHPFDEDERRRRMSPPPWPPLEHFRRGRSPPGEELRGRPPPPEEFDRFGRPIPPPWDRERRDWRRPPEEERFRDLPHPADRWRRSPSPHRELLERFPPDHPKEWERDGRRGPDDRFYDERPPPDRLPPIDDHYRDRPRYPEDRPPHDPAAYPPHPHDSRHPTEAPRLEKKPETVPVESILDPPGRDSRPDRIVIILRGPPGSGKTHVARLIKDKEVNNGAHAPRILALDDYFLMEVEKVEQDPETGKKVKKKVTEYVFEEEMEEAYQASLFKSFSKTLEDGFFPVVIVDAIHDKVEHFEKYWSHAKQKGFEVYVAELMADAHACAKRNSHNRTFEDINKMVAAWEETPVHHLRLDVRSLLQDAVITEVEMEAADESAVEASSEEMDKQQEPVEEVESEIQVPSRSKWEEMEPAEDKLNKLDGIRLMKGKRKREESPPMHFSDDDDPYDEREEDMRIGKKRVRWADLEEKKELEHRRRIGFCIGTDWSLLTDPHAEIPRM